MTAPKNVAAELAALHRMTVGELREKYLVAFCRYIRTGVDHFSLLFTYAWVAANQGYGGPRIQVISIPRNTKFPFDRTFPPLPRFGRGSPGGGRGLSLPQRANAAISCEQIVRSRSLVVSPGTWQTAKSNGRILNGRFFSAGTGGF